MATLANRVLQNMLFEDIVMSSFLFLVWFIIFYVIMKTSNSI